MELGRQQKANAFCAVFLGCVNRCPGRGLAFALVHYRRAGARWRLKRACKIITGWGKDLRKEKLLKGLLLSLWNQVPDCYNVCGAIDAFGTSCSCLRDRGCLESCLNGAGSRLPAANNNVVRSLPTLIRLKTAAREPWTSAASDLPLD